MKLAALNEHAAAARLRVDALEAELAAAYLAALRAAGRKAAARFRGAVTVKAITAATNPWVPPDPAELLDQEALAAAAQKKAKPVQERALRLAVPVGISFDLANPLATAFLDGIAARSAQILDGFATEIGAAIGQAYDEGLSVPKAAQLLRSRIETATEIQAKLLARSDLVSIANGGSLLAAQIVNQASVDAGETGVRFKIWKTAEDDRVRPDHADADGQAVPLDQPFDVGGEQLQYPGDPAGSDEQVLNCRCAVLYGDEAMTAAMCAPDDHLSSGGTMTASPEVTPAPLVLRDFHLTAAAGEPTRWQATLLVEDEPTEDGRMIAAEATTWRSLPLPLAILDASMHSDGAEAPVCGRIDQIWRAGALIQAAGVFDTSPNGVEAERMVRERMITGISCDGVATSSEVVVSRPEPDPEEEQELLDEVAPVIDGDPVPEYDEDLEYLFVATEYVIMGATICPAGAIAQARIEVVTAASGAENWQVTAPFEASRCEIPGTFAVGDEMSRAEALAFVSRHLTAALAAPDAGATTTEPDPALAKMRSDLAALREAFTQATTLVASELSEQRKLVSAEMTGARRELRDELAAVTGQQAAVLTASAATEERLASFEEKLGVLDTIADGVARAVELAERKPRQLEIKRDTAGRIVGSVEV